MLSIFQVFTVHIYKGLREISLQILCLLLNCVLCLFLVCLFVCLQFYNNLTFRSEFSSIPSTDFWKWCGDKYIGNQYIEPVWWFFYLIRSSGQCTDIVWDIPYSIGPDSFVKPHVHAHIRSSHLLHGKLLDLSEYPRALLLVAHSMDVLVNADGVFSGHYLVNGRTALLTTILCENNSASSRLEKKSMRHPGRRETA